jgi:predicted GNAT family acetyltransferase|tara:strand:+ start:9333 stop:9818 length:486 start_codon:yes stop_codon:yes gene_type:complete
MKLWKNKLEDFFKWVKGTELVELDDIDVSEDPVRPELTLGWRITKGRKIFGLKYDNEIEGVICIAFTNDVPTSLKELDIMSELADIKNEKKIAIAYTVWSRKRGAGKEIVNKVIEYAKKNKIERVITLSPLTPMATHFHIRNGAKQININEETQNFEYEIR